ncbi:hypothetical protein [Bradyrhizobium sp. LMTR 3]|uniref:hypothetical protein n=1 Tax=Bradyrhizobium sp. LMTR 3 TaxID=189873 RepID=UPI0015B6B288|nr:hypothetical protein [Bradyrhizobium sp. LMTR 3]
MKSSRKKPNTEAGRIVGVTGKHAHCAWTGNEEAVLQVQFTGPGIDYVNPADDPRKN